MCTIQKSVPLLHKVVLHYKSIPASCAMVQGWTQPLPEMSTRNLTGSKGKPASKVDNLTAICEPIVYEIGEP
jgi:hypothetical protein